MNTYIPIGILGALALVVIVHEIHGLWRDATGTGGRDDGAGSSGGESEDAMIRRKTEQRGRDWK